MTHAAGVKRMQNRNRPSDRRMGDGNPNLKPSQRISKIVVKCYLSIAAHAVTVTSPESGDARGSLVRRKTQPAKEMQISLF